MKSIEAHHKYSCIKKKTFQTIFVFSVFSCLSNPLGMTLTDSADQFQTYQKAFVFK